jgi:ketosteroid isomerase-like protein
LFHPCWEGRRSIYYRYMISCLVLTEGGVVSYVIDATREQNEEVLRRFFSVDIDGAERRSLWAHDALFEMPFQHDGPEQIRGREAIMAESEEWGWRIHDHRFFDLMIHATLDPTVFWVTVTSECKDRNDETWTTELVNYFRVVDGHVAHRREYFDPVTHPPLS